MFKWIIVLFGFKIINKRNKPLDNIIDLETKKNYLELKFNYLEGNSREDIFGSNTIDKIQVSPPCISNNKWVVYALRQKTTIIDSLFNTKTTSHTSKIFSVSDENIIDLDDYKRFVSK